jgi:hypothetical protein
MDGKLNISLDKQKGDFIMTFKEKCVEAFKDYIDVQNIESHYKKFFIETFSAGFEYGSLNGASEDIKDSVVKNINLKKDRMELAKELFEKFL